MKKIITILICLLPMIAMADDFTLYLNGTYITSLSGPPDQRDSNFSAQEFVRIFDDNSTYGRQQGLIGNTALSDTVTLHPPDSAIMFLDHWANDEGVTTKAILYGIKRVVVYNQATWNSYSTGNAWQTAGAAGANDRSGLMSNDTITVNDTLDNGYYRFKLNVDSLELYEHFIIQPVQNSDTYNSWDFEDDSIYVKGYYTTGGCTAPPAMSAGDADSVHSDSSGEADLMTFDVLSPDTSFTGYIKVTWDDAGYPDSSIADSSRFVFAGNTTFTDTITFVGTETYTLYFSAWAVNTGNSCWATRHTWNQSFTGAVVTKTYLNLGE
jgi:hypothetical protein